ncbi:MAG TPA: CPBP family glutamic-type intramembrane protease [Chthoniobacterales bacterium]|nr:CPBP family glutamic-type intramembrane protease [Chthoniobacterales bacterium]
MMRADAAQAGLQLGYPWRVFWVLLGAGVLAALGALPYVLALFGDKLVAAGGRPIRLPLLIVMQSLHTTLVLGILIGLGLLLARKVGVDTPILNAWLYGIEAERRRVPLVLATAAGVGLGLLSAGVLYAYMAPQVPQWPSEAGIPIWMRVLISIYSGIDEELATRLFLLSLVLWILQKIRRRSERPSATVFWIGNTIVAVLFAAAYLPTASYLLPMTQVVVSSILALKAVSGLVFGYLCWSRGLETAMLAHFVTDLVMHLVGPLLEP